MTGMTNEETDEYKKGFTTFDAEVEAKTPDTIYAMDSTKLQLINGREYVFPAASKDTVAEFDRGFALLDQSMREATSDPEGAQKMGIEAYAIVGRAAKESKGMVGDVYQVMHNLKQKGQIPFLPHETPHCIDAMVDDSDGKDLRQYNLVRQGVKELGYQLDAVHTNYEKEKLAHSKAKTEHGQAVSKLEATLTEKDRRIAELEAEVQTKGQAIGNYRSFLGTIQRKSRDE
jgi:hypothetical protein